MPRLAEAVRHQRLDPLLGGRSPERSDHTIEDHNPDLLISLQSSDDFLELLNPNRAHDVDRELSIVTRQLAGDRRARRISAGAADAFICVSLLGALIVAWDFPRRPLSHKKMGREIGR
jgi:hypothetical protein